MDDNDTGSQIERVAADGGRMPAAANNAGDWLNMIEDGQFSADLQAGLAELALTLGDQAVVTGKRAKGKVTITVDLTNENGYFNAVAKFAIKTPELPRKPTLLWTDEHNRFMRNQPRQGGFFGVREVTLDKGDVRTVG